MSHLNKAFADTARSYTSAKASLGQNAEAILAQSSGGSAYTSRHDLTKASEQLKHLRGWVYTSIRPIAQRIAGQPVHVGLMSSLRPSSTKSTGAHPEALDGHPLIDLISNPNDVMVAWSLMYSTVASLELTGRALWWLPKKEQILPIPISWLKGFEGSTKFTSFRIRPPGQTEDTPLPADECCFFNYPDPADPHGAISPLQALAYSVDADEAMEISQASMFRRGIYPSHIVRVGKNANGIRPRLSPSQQRQIINAIKKVATSTSR